MVKRNFAPLISYLIAVLKDKYMNKQVKSSNKFYREVKSCKMHYF